jgi:hypothetical protein
MSELPIATDAREKSPFDQIRHVDGAGEYWLAREMQPYLDYTQWRNFEKNIKTAAKACKESGIDPDLHFVPIKTFVKIGSRATRQIQDYRMTNYAVNIIVTLSIKKQNRYEDGFVYFLKSPINNMVKIGFTNSLESRRLEDIRLMSPVPLRLLGTIRGSAATERSLHRRFAELRHHGEWFTIDESLEDFIRSNVKQAKAESPGSGPVAGNRPGRKVSVRSGREFPS